MIKRILLLVLCFVSFSVIAQQDLSQVDKPSIKITANKDIKFMLYINDKVKTEIPVSEMLYKRVRANKVYEVRVKVITPEIKHNEVTMELMIAKSPIHLVVTIDEDRNSVNLLTYKSYDRMMKKRIWEAKMNRTECWEQEYENDSVGCNGNVY